MSGGAGSNRGETRETMRAVVPTRGGGPEVLKVETRPVPSPGPGEALIAVAFAGVNRHDCGQRSRGAPPAGATDVLGLEVSGEIVAVGAGVPADRVGAKVCALVNGGGYADYCLAEADLALPRPAALTMEQAAAAPEALFTCWFNLFEIAGLASGRSLLVHGGASGVGSTAIQLARAFNVTVLVTAGSAEKCDACLGFGAERAINYRGQDFVAAVLDATGGRGVDVILDMAGAAYAERNLRALAKDGFVVHLTSGSSSGGEQSAPLPLRLIMERRARVTGSLMRGLEPARKRRVAQALEQTVWPLLGAQVTPVLDRVFALSDVVAAHERIEAGENIGKILLDVTR